MVTFLALSRITTDKSVMRVDEGMPVLSSLVEEIYS